MTRTIVKLSAISAIALSLAACGGSGSEAKKDGPAKDLKIDQVAAPAGKKWEETVVKTADGGFLMGNPDAKVKVIEYAALSCSHCADFSKESAEVMKNKYVASGQVSYEMRNFSINPTLDIPAAAITHCVGEARYFPLTESVFAGQGELFANAQSADQNELKRIQSMPPSELLPAFAKAIKLDQFFKARGVTDAEINSCLGNSANLAAIEKITNDGSKQFSITGTPTFIIDGKKAEFSNDKPLWESVQEAINAKL